MAMEELNSKLEGFTRRSFCDCKLRTRGKQCVLCVPGVEAFTRWCEALGMASSIRRALRTSPTMSSKVRDCIQMANSPSGTFMIALRGWPRSSVWTVDFGEETTMQLLERVD